jgi:hypothetical protein
MALTAFKGWMGDAQRGAVSVGSYKTYGSYLRSKPDSNVVAVLTISFVEINCSLEWASRLHIGWPCRLYGSRWPRRMATRKSAPEERAGLRGGAAAVIDVGNLGIRLDTFLNRKPGIACYRRQRFGVVFAVVCICLLGGTRIASKHQCSLHHFDIRALNIIYTTCQSQQLTAKLPSTACWRRNTCHRRLETPARKTCSSYFRASGC